MGRRLDHYRFKTRAIAEQRPDEPSDKKSKPPERLLTWTEACDIWPPLSVFAVFNWIGGVWFYLWRRAPGVRFLVEVGGAAIIVAGAYGLYAELQQRDIDRVTRHATLMTQMAELATNQGRDAVDPAIRRILETLVDEKASLDGFALPGVNIAGADLVGASLRGANLNGAILGGPTPAGGDEIVFIVDVLNTIEAMLSGTEWDSADLIPSNLMGANLTGANLSLANLKQASLYSVKLGEAKLLGTDLTGADLTGANLTRANLTGAELTLADLMGANLTGVNLTASLGLTQEELERACQKPQAKAPRLPAGLQWHGRVCEPYK